MAVARLEREGRATIRGDKTGKLPEEKVGRNGGNFLYLSFERRLGRRTKMAARKEMKRKKLEGIDGKLKIEATSRTAISLKYVHPLQYARCFVVGPQLILVLLAICILKSGKVTSGRITVVKCSR